MSAQFEVASPTVESSTEEPPADTPAVTIDRKDPVAWIPDQALVVARLDVRAFPAVIDDAAVVELVYLLGYEWRLAQDLRICGLSVGEVEIAALGFRRRGYDSPGGMALAIRTREPFDEGLAGCALERDRLRHPDAVGNEAFQARSLGSRDFVFTRGGWMEDVVALAGGQGTPAIAGSLRASMAHLDVGRPVWFVKGAEDDDAFISKLSGNHDVLTAGHAEFGDQVRLSAFVRYDTVEHALAAVEGCNRRRREYERVAADSGIKPSPLESAAIVAEGSDVRVALRLATSGLVAAAKRVKDADDWSKLTWEARSNVAAIWEAIGRLAMQARDEGGKVQCRIGGRTKGKTPVTPPLSVRCAEGPEGKCTPGKKGPGGYPAKVWETAEWKTIGFAITEPHRFHYSAEWASDDRGTGQCTWSIRAHADFDGDGEYSTFERPGIATEEGANAAAPLQIENERE